ncbi:MAG: nuclear transport factor 2 family protein [Burkholderiales bacterium]|nr:nuclear transport factor 2 family protein [Burkholderiales bacterium]
MTTLEIGQKLVDLCMEGKSSEAQDTLYAEDAVSVEVAPMADMPQTAEGLEAIKAKSAWWYDNHEIHAFDVSGPWPHGDRFIVIFDLDVTNKPSGMRMQMSEAGLYTVADGKIVKEEFFYTMEP